MISFYHLQVDATTNEPFRSSQWVVFLDTDRLVGETKLAIVKEMYLSNTFFVGKSDVAEFGGSPDTLEDLFSETTTG